MISAYISFLSVEGSNNKGKAGRDFSKSHDENSFCFVWYGQDCPGPGPEGTDVVLETPVLGWGG